jgi:hypothetical protein
MALFDGDERCVFISASPPIEFQPKRGQSRAPSARTWEIVSPEVGITETQQNISSR